MSQYKIERWDAVMFGNSISKVPMIYIKPDVEFLEFVRENNFAVICEIQGTDMMYDGKLIPGVVDKSCFVPNCRPNYYEKTGYYVITLVANWDGYPHPDKLGTAIFKGLKGKMTEEEYKDSIQASKNIAPTQTGMYALRIILAIGLVVLLFLVYFKARKNNSLNIK